MKLSEPNSKGITGYIALALSATQLIFTLAGGINDLASLPQTIKKLPETVSQEIVQPVQDKAVKLQQQLEELQQKFQEELHNPNLNGTKEPYRSVQQFSNEFQYIGSQIKIGVKRVQVVRDLEGNQSAKAALAALEVQSEQLQQEIGMLEALSREIEASQEAARWLELETQQKAIAKQVGDIVIAELAQQGTHQNTSDNETFYLDIFVYLYLIYRCLKSCRTNFIDSAISERKIPRSLVFTSAAYTRAFALIKDPTIVTRNLSEEAENQLQFYLNHIIKITNC
jgi:hypothetical protein